MSSENKKILCHQYATGRADSGYGFVAYSREENGEQKATYQFSPSQGVSLRFMHLPEGTSSVLEIEPASTDYLHLGAFRTKERNDAGTVSVYTHVLMTEKAEAKDAFGLILNDEKNFLTPDEFTEVTQGKRILRKEEKDGEMPEKSGEELTEVQKKKAGEFLARYWLLLEMKEYPGKHKPEIGLLLPKKTKEQAINFFATEIVDKLPKYVKPAVSVAFGANWNNRGNTPCVCCVLSDNKGNPYPLYTIDIDSPNNSTWAASDTEKQIGTILIKGEEEYPQIYMSIQKMADTDNRFRAMARGFSAMAFSVKARQAKDVSEMKKIYEQLLLLAEKRYDIRKEEIMPSLIPLIITIVEKSSKDDQEYIITKNIEFHQLQNVDLADLDQKTFEFIDKSIPHQKKKYLWQLYEGRKDEPAAEKIELMEKLLEAVLPDNHNNLNDIMDKAELKKVAEVRYILKQNEKNIQEKTRKETLDNILRKIQKAENEIGKYISRQVKQGLKQNAGNQEEKQNDKIYEGLSQGLKDYYRRLVEDLKEEFQLSEEEIILFLTKVEASDIEESIKLNCLIHQAGIEKEEQKKYDEDTIQFIKKKATDTQEQIDSYWKLIQTQKDESVESRLPLIEEMIKCAKELSAQDRRAGVIQRLAKTRQEFKGKDQDNYSRIGEILIEHISIDANDLISSKIQNKEKPESELREAYEQFVKKEKDELHVSEGEIQKALIMSANKLLKETDNENRTQDEELGKILQANLILHTAGLNTSELSEQLRTIDVETEKRIEKLSDARKKSVYFWRLFESKTAESVETKITLIEKYLNSIKEPGAKIEIEDLQRVALIRCGLAEANLKDKSAFQTAGSILTCNMLKWQDEADYGLDPRSGKEEKNVELFPELLTDWFCRKEKDSTKTEFEKIEWSIPGLEEMISKATHKMNQGKSSKHKEELFQILACAEEKLYELHEHEDRDKDSLTSALRQCKRLRKASKAASVLANKYLSLIKGSKNDDIFQILNKEKSLVKDERDLFLEILTQLFQNVKPEETEIVNCLHALNILSEEDPGKAQELRNKNGNRLIELASQTEDLSITGSKMIISFILSRDLDSVSFENAYKIAINHASEDGIIEYVEQLTEKAGLSPYSKQRSFCDKILTQVEECAKARLKSSKLDEETENILKLNNNKLPEEDMPYCTEIATERLRKALELFFHETDSEDPSMLEKKWNESYSRSYSKEWREINSEQLEKPLESFIDKGLKRSENQIEFLASLWEKVNNSGTEVWTHQRVFRNQLIKKLESSYDELWRGQGGRIQTNENREKLDAMREECEKEEEKNGWNRLRSIRNTKAWEAKCWQDDFYELNRSSGIDKSPEEIGKLIKRIRTPEKEEMKGFGNCIQLDRYKTEQEKRTPEGKENLRRLVIPMISELLRNPEGSDYWGKTLEELDFRKDSDPWEKDGMRMLNILAFIIGALNRMNIPEFAGDLREWLGTEYMNVLRADKVQKAFEKDGKMILSKSLFDWTFGMIK